VAVDAHGTAYLLHTRRGCGPELHCWGLAEGLQVLTRVCCCTCQRLAWHCGYLMAP
jgi:hypothetical protein